MLAVVFRNPWVQAALALAALVLVGALVVLLRPVLVPLFLALLAAYVVHPMVTLLERRRVPRGAGVALIGAAGIVLLAAVPLWVVPRALAEAEAFIAASRADVRPGEWYEWFEERLPLERWARSAGWLSEDAEVVDLRQVLAERIEAFITASVPKLIDAAQEAFWPMATRLAAFGRSAAAFLFFLGNVVIFVFVAGYLLRDFDRLIENASELVPMDWRPKTFEIVRKIDQQLRSFLRGQLLVCAGLAVMYTAGLLASGAPFAVVIGLFGGAVSFVPYLGFALTIGPAALLTLLQYGVGWRIAGVLATFMIAQTIESVVLTPKAVGKSVGLNPVWVILAIMVFGSAFGFLGLLIAAPAAAVLKVLVLEGIGLYKRSALFRARVSSTDEDAG